MTSQEFWSEYKRLLYESLKTQFNNEDDWERYFEMHMNFQNGVDNTGLDEVYDIAVREHGAKNVHRALYSLVSSSYMCFPDY